MKTACCGNFPQRSCLAIAGRRRHRQPVGQYGQVVALPENHQPHHDAAVWLDGRDTNEAAAIPGRIARNGRAAARTAGRSPRRSRPRRCTRGCWGRCGRWRRLTRVKVYENDTHDTDANGNPGPFHLLRGGKRREDAALRKRSSTESPSGSGTYGEETGNGNRTASGNKNSISFQRPAYVILMVTVNRQAAHRVQRRQRHACGNSGRDCQLLKQPDHRGRAHGVAAVVGGDEHDGGAERANVFDHVRHGRAGMGRRRGRRTSRSPLTSVARGNVNYIEVVSG